MDEDKALQFVIETASEAVEDNKDWRTNAAKCIRFVAGNQWEDADRASLEEQGVVPISVNHILGIRDNVCGRQVQNPKDIKVRPVKGGNSTVANIYSALIKDTITRNNGFHLVMEYFKSGVTTGRGWISADKDLTMDPINGDITIELNSPFDVYPDMTHNDYDLNIGGKYIHIYKWINKEKVAAMFPDRSDDLGNLKTGEAVISNKEVQVVTDYMLGDESSTPEFEENAELYAHYCKRNHRVRKSFFLTYEHVCYWLDYKNREIKRLTKDKKIAEAKNSAKKWPRRFKVIESAIPVLHKVMSVGKILLKYEEDPFGFKDSFFWQWGEDGPEIYEVPGMYPIVLFRPYFEQNENGSFTEFGKVDNLIGPQVEENKRRTQLLRIIGTTANSGFQSKEQNLSEPMKKLITDFGSRPGIFIEYKDEPVRKIEPSAPPMGVVAALGNAKEDMKEIAHDASGTLGFPVKEQMSGRAVMAWQNDALIGNELVFGHFDYSNQIFSSVLINIIRCGNFYSMAEIKAIVDKENLINKEIIEEAVTVVGPSPEPPPPPDPNLINLAKQRFGQKGADLEVVAMRLFNSGIERYQKDKTEYDKILQKKSEEILFDKLKNLKIGRYGTAMVQSPASPTLRYAHFTELSEIEKIRPGQLPLEVFIDASDIQNKEAIKEKIKEQAQSLQGALNATVNTKTG